MNNSCGPDFDTLQNSFGCVAGYVLKTKDKRIKCIRVTSWGYQ